MCSDEAGLPSEATLQVVLPQLARQPKEARAQQRASCVLQLQQGLGVKVVRDSSSFLVPVQSPVLVQSPVPVQGPELQPLLEVYPMSRLTTWRLLCSSFLGSRLHSPTGTMALLPY